MITAGTKRDSETQIFHNSMFDCGKSKEDDIMKGIDVSVHNGNIDWNRVKNAGIQFAILRAGYGKVASQQDRKFEENYNGAKAAGVPAVFTYHTRYEEYLHNIPLSKLFVSKKVNRKQDITGTYVFKNYLK